MTPVKASGRSSVAKNGNIVGTKVVPVPLSVLGQFEFKFLLLSGSPVLFGSYLRLAFS